MAEWVELTASRRTQAQGLARGADGQAEGGARRHPGNLRRQQPHPLRHRTLRQGRLPRHRARDVRPLPARLRNRLRPRRHGRGDGDRAEDRRRPRRSSTSTPRAPTFTRSAKSASSASASAARWRGSSACRLKFDAASCYYGGQIAAHERPKAEMPRHHAFRRQGRAHPADAQSRRSARPNPTCRSTSTTPTTASPATNARPTTKTPTNSPGAARSNSSPKRCIDFA